MEELDIADRNVSMQEIFSSYTQSTFQNSSFLIYIETFKGPHRYFLFSNLRNSCMESLNRDFRYVKLFNNSECTHVCEHTHKASVDHEIAFTPLTILIYLTQRKLINHSWLISGLKPEPPPPPKKLERCVKTTEPTHTHTYSVNRV